jgi:hypothetical protein
VISVRRARRAGIPDPAVPAISRSDPVVQLKTMACCPRFAPSLRYPVNVIRMHTMHPVGQANPAHAGETPGIVVVKESEMVMSVHFPKDDAGLASKLRLSFHV